MRFLRVCRSHVCIRTAVFKHSLLHSLPQAKQPLLLYYQLHLHLVLWSLKIRPPIDRLTYTCMDDI